MKRILRASAWWDYKLPPMLALAYFLLGRAEPSVPLGVALGDLALFLTASVGIAGFGHVLNDWCDVPQDRLSGSSNIVDRLGRLASLGLLAVLLGVAWLPWAALPVGGPELALVGLEFALFAVYSLPPVRLKERGLWGVAADALYAHAVPTLVIWLTFSRVCGVEPSAVFGILLGAWAFLVGVRHIVLHQSVDLARDRASGTRTFVALRGESAAFALVDRLVPVEAGAFVGILSAMSADAPAAGIGFVCYAGWTAYRVCVSWLRPFGRAERGVGATGPLAFVFLTRFYEMWLPLLTLVATVGRDPTYAGLAALHVLCFKNGIWQLWPEDVPALRG